MPDGFELDHGLNPIVDDRFGDLDGDGYVNHLEYEFGTDIDNSDSFPSGLSLEDGLVAFLPFDGDARDASGNENDGTVNGASLTLDRFGNADSAFSFDGNDYILIADTASLDIETAITITGWVNLNTLSPSWQAILSKGPEPYETYALFTDYTTITTNSLHVVNRINGTRRYWNTDDLIDHTGIWYFFAVTYDGTESHSYINGNYAGGNSRIGRITPNNYALWIGGRQSSSTYLNGTIDDIRIYNRALSEVEIQRLYNQDGSYDFDEDGMPNIWELENGLNPNDPTDAERDDDNDNLTNIDEYQNLTDPQNSDTDGDSMPDGWEVQYGLNPSQSGAADDSDADGLNDLQEYHHLTDPTNPDTDGDGISDGDEVDAGTDPLAMSSSLTSEIAGLTLSLGANRTVMFRLENTRRETDQFDISVTGIDSGWYTLEQTQITLAAGEVREIPLSIELPVDCGLSILDYTVHVTAESDETGLVQNGGADLALQVSTIPLLTDLFPANGEQLGTNMVQMSWETDAETTPQLSYRIQGDPDYSVIDGTAGQIHQLAIDSLAWDTTYEWYVAAQGPCGTTQSEVRTFNVLNGVVFTDRDTTANILRDYDQQIHLDILNQGVASHDVRVEVINPHEDLIAGFIGSGSIDTTMTLAAGESADVTLALHAQDTLNDQYQLTLKLTADIDTATPIVDYAKLTVNVTEPEFNLNIEETETNPAILTNTYTIRNDGDTITDLRVFVFEDVAPQVVFQPQVDHMRIEHGETITFSATFLPVNGMEQYTGDLLISGAGNQTSFATIFGCETGTSLFDVTLTDAHVCLQKASWYCTNRPHISVNFDLPGGIQPQNITGARLYINFSLKASFGSYRNHNVTVLFNGTEIERFTNTIPNGPYGIEVPTSLLRTGDQSNGLNRVTLQTEHMNGGHYAIASDFQLIVDTNLITLRSICATSQAEADQAAQGLPWICDGTPQWQPCPFAGSVENLDEEGVARSAFIPGETVQFKVPITNPDLDAHTATLSFTVTAAEVLYQQNRTVSIASTNTDYLYLWWTIPEDTQPSFLTITSTVTSDASCENETVLTNHLSIWNPVSDFSVTPNQHDFGSVSISSTESKIFTVTNTGDLSIDLADLTISGDAPFSIEDDNCSQVTLPPAQSCTYSVGFTPDAETNFYASISIPSTNADVGTIVLPVNGNGYIVTDRDGDGIYDTDDNCPDTANADQFDLDGDTIGDLCDDDVDGDGIPNDTDNDDDNDGMSDECENAYVGLDPFDPTDAAADFDSDNLTNLEECDNNTDPNNSDTDGDGIRDDYEVDFGSDPTAIETVSIKNASKEVLVSLTGDNRIYVTLFNGFLVPKSVQFGLSGLDASWYTIEPEDQSFTMLPFGLKVVTVQLHLPEDCDIPTETYPFIVQIDYDHNGQSFSNSDTGNLVVTPNPNIYRLAIPRNTIMAGNNIHIAWKTDIPTDGYVYYRQAGDEEFTQIEAGADSLEHRVLLPDLEFQAYYEYYTESHSSCGGLTTTELAIVKTGKAVKFVNSVNEFWVDRDYYQPVTLSITNTDLIEHTYQLSVINAHNDIVVDFVGDGSNGRGATLEPGASTDVELVVHAQDAITTDYDIYLKIVSEPDELNTFTDYSHAIIHVRPFVANLELQPLASTPGMMTYSFNLMNYGDTLSDIEIYVDEESRAKTYFDAYNNHLRLETGGSEQIVIHALEHTTGTIYARSGDYVVSAPFEIGCPDGTDLNTYTLNDLSVVAQINDWYCTNKKNLTLPFAIPTGIKKDGIREAAVEVNFSLPMSMDKYDPHSVRLYINKDSGHDNPIGGLEDVIPDGQYIFRFPADNLNLGMNAPSENFLTVEVEGIGEGQYIVATDFRVILNIDEMEIDLCIPDYTPPPPVELPPSSTKIVNVGPKTKFRPGETVTVTVDLQNDDNQVHSGILTVTLANNSNTIDGGGVSPPAPEVAPLDIEPGDFSYTFNYTIPEYADDIEYTLSAVFENETLGETKAVYDKPVFYVRTPLIIVHGIKGSFLKNEEETLWIKGLTVISMGIDRLTFSNATSPCDEWLGLLSYRFDGGQWVSSDPQVYADGPIKAIPPVINTFQGLENLLVDTRNRKNNYILETENGEDQDIFYFSYDWRQSNTLSSAQLKSFISDVIETTGYDHANIIAHSMGGLVTKDLLLNHLTTPLNDDVIRKVVFVGTPHLGAADAFSALKYGVDVASGLKLKLLGNTINLQANEKINVFLSEIEELSNLAGQIANPDITDIIANILLDASQLEPLLPSSPEDCNAVNLYLDFSNNLIGLIQSLNQYDGFDAATNAIGILKDINYLYSTDLDGDGVNDYQMALVSRNWPSMYELLPSAAHFELTPYYYMLNANPVDDYQSMKVEIMDIDGLLPEHAQLIDIAENMHAGIDQMDLQGMPIKSYSIVGCRKDTTSQIVENTERGYVTFLKEDGDGRVTLDSALSVDVDHKYAAFNASHANLPSQGGVKLLLRSLLKGYETNYETNIFKPVVEYYDNCCEQTKIKITFPDFTFQGSTWQWPEIECEDCGPTEFNRYTNNGIYIGIVGSDYRVTNEGLEIYVPEGAIYTLKFDGVDQEYLNIKFQLMTEGGVIRTYIFDNITLDIDGCGEVTFDLTNALVNPVMRLDDQCDGTYEEENIPPSRILDETESNDIIAPVTTAEVNGTLGDNDWYVSDVSIALSVMEEGGSGLLATRYRFSGDVGYTDYSGPILLTEPGTYMMTYFSIDRNLNKETEKVLEIKIDDGEPQINSLTDGDSVYELDAVDLCWEIQTGSSSLQNIEYSVGTGPGLTDIQDWTDTGSQETAACAQIAGLSTICDAPVYFNLRASNVAGRQSEVMSTDGVIVLATGSDPDGDTYVNEDEISAGSDPCNPYSIPKNSTIQLTPGFNMVSIPAEIQNRQDLNDWLPLLGSSEDIDKVMVYNEMNRRFVTLIPESTTNPSYLLQGGEALIVYAKQDVSIDFTSALCNPVDLEQGFNFVGMACVPADYSAFDLLNAIGNLDAISIQRFDNTSGKFETAAFDESGHANGVDFPITAGQGYIVNMGNALSQYEP